jgi:hypothetical protein
MNYHSEEPQLPGKHITAAIKTAGCIEAWIITVRSYHFQGKHTTATAKAASSIAEQIIIVSQVTYCKQPKASSSAQPNQSSLVVV